MSRRFRWKYFLQQLMERKAKLSVIGSTGVTSEATATILSMDGWARACASIRTEERATGPCAASAAWARAHGKNVELVPKPSYGVVPPDEVHSGTGWIGREALIQQLELLVAADCVIVIWDGISPHVAHFAGMVARRALPLRVYHLSESEDSTMIGDIMGSPGVPLEVISWPCHDYGGGPCNVVNYGLPGRPGRVFRDRNAEQLIWNGMCVLGVEMTTPVIYDVDGQET